MKLLGDMNLSPDWLPVLSARGWQVENWSQVGLGNARDSELLRWARKHGYAVVTPDWDFSQLLFATQASGPSVVLLPVENEFDTVTFEHIYSSVALAEDAFKRGALLTVSGGRAHLRRLPIVQERSLRGLPRMRRRKIVEKIPVSGDASLLFLTLPFCHPLLPHEIIPSCHPPSARADSATFLRPAKSRRRRSRAPGA